MKQENKFGCEREGSRGKGAGTNKRIWEQRITRKEEPERQAILDLGDRARTGIEAKQEKERASVRASRCRPSGRSGEQPGDRDSNGRETQQQTNSAVRKQVVVSLTTNCPCKRNRL